MRSLETLAACTVLTFSTLGYSERSYAGFSQNKLDIKAQIHKDINDIERVRKSEETQRDNIFIGYKEWMNLIENPLSNDAIRTRCKARLICELNERDPLYKYLSGRLSPEQEKDLKVHQNTFSLDIAKLKPDRPEYNEIFMQIGFPMILGMQIELDKTYQRTFNYNDGAQSAGQKLLFSIHFGYERRYLSEGNKMPEYLDFDKYLEKKQAEFDKEVVLKKDKEKTNKNQTLQKVPKIRCSQRERWFPGKRVFRSIRGR